MMQYDIAAKVIVEIGKEELLRHFLHVEPVAMELLEEIPQETASLRSSDFPLRLQTAEGEEKIVLLEFQTVWEVDAVWRMMDYACRFKLKYRLPVVPAMLLFRRHPTASGVYRDECFEFRYRLVKLWEQPAREVLERRLYPLLPFTPAMDATEEDVLAAERQLYESPLPKTEKADLLTALGLFAGLRAESLAQRLFERRRDIMIQSPMYDLIKREGLLEGIEKGIEKGMERGMEKGMEKGMEEGKKWMRSAVAFALQARFGEDAKALESRVKAIDEIGRLEAIHRAVVGGKPLEDVKELISA